jgi:hypothetical protein
MVLVKFMSMRKIMIVLLALLFVTRPCYAFEHSDDILALIKLSPRTTTQEHITAMFGQPVKIEENSRRSWWHYDHGTSNLVICWNKKTDMLEKLSFSSVQSQKPIFDNNIYRKLKSGATDISQAVKLLGQPKDMTLKTATQEMHYAYQKNVLRLFFRDKVLVDFTLLSQK